ncbi:hypothetical protein C8R48DRAFT_671397 [Suillus tomentosus]|nr:hypothetical protein C8R48DRAFT_671397 [Suillus tomentosus]
MYSGPYAPPADSAGSLRYSFTPLCGPTTVAFMLPLGPFKAQSLIRAHRTRAPTDSGPVPVLECSRPGYETTTRPKGQPLREVPRNKVEGNSAREDNAREGARARGEGARDARYTKIRENESVRTWDGWTDDSAKTYEEARERARIARLQFASAGISNFCAVLDAIGECREPTAIHWAHSMQGAHSETYTYNICWAHGGLALVSWKKCQVLGEYEVRTYLGDMQMV